MYFSDLELAQMVPALKRGYWAMRDEDPQDPDPRRLQILEILSRIRAESKARVDLADLDRWEEKF